MKVCWGKIILTVCVYGVLRAGGGGGLGAVAAGAVQRVPTSPWGIRIQRTQRQCQLVPGRAGLREKDGKAMFFRTCWFAPNAKIMHRLIFQRVRFVFKHMPHHWWSAMFPWLQSPSQKSMRREVRRNQHTQQQCELLLALFSGFNIVCIYQAEQMTQFENEAQLQQEKNVLAHFRRQMHTPQWFQRMR